MNLFVSNSDSPEMNIIKTQLKLCFSLPLVGPKLTLQIRKMAGMSLRDVAKDSDVSASTIMRYEKGGDISHNNYVKLWGFYRDLIAK